MLNGHGYGMHFVKKGIISFFDTHMHREKYIFEREIFSSVNCSKYILSLRSSRTNSGSDAPHGQHSDLQTNFALDMEIILVSAASVS